MTFSSLGFAKIAGFVDDKFVSDLNTELDSIFKTATINGCFGYIKSSKYTKAVPFPFVYIKSANLMNFIIDVADRIQSQRRDSRELTLREIQIFSELGDNDELGWHTDSNLNAVLAICYLKGGGNLVAAACI